MNKEENNRLDRLERKIDDIKDNHLPHIYEVLGKLSGRWNVMIPLTIAILTLLAGLYVLFIVMNTDLSRLWNTIF